jgi:hypothetical protein
MKPEATMSEGPDPRPLLQGFKKSDFDIRTLADEIRVDKLCVELIRHFFHHLIQDNSCPRDDAGKLSHGVDYFFREFLIPDRRDNLFFMKAVRVRQFAGHWYITHTLEPNLNELTNILRGVARFYSFLGKQGLISLSDARSIAGACDDLPYYAERIETFWAIECDGYDIWRQGCPLD